MENKQMWVRTLSLFGFALLGINGIFSFGNMGSTTFVQVFFALIVVGLVIAAMQQTGGDAEKSAPVIGAAVLYFVGLIIRVVLFVIDAFVDFCRALSLQNLDNKLDYFVFPDSATAEEMTFLTAKREELREQRSALREVIDRDTFGEIMDVVIIIFAIATIIVAIYSIIQILRKKDFATTILGRFTYWVMGKSGSEKVSAKAKKISENTQVEVDAENEKTE